MEERLKMQQQAGKTKKAAHQPARQQRQQPQRISTQFKLVFPIGPYRADVAFQSAKKKKKRKDQDQDLTL